MRREGEKGAPANEELQDTINIVLVTRSAWPDNQRLIKVIYKRATEPSDKQADRDSRWTCLVHGLRLHNLILLCTISYHYDAIIVQSDHA